ncbi:glycine--tRNA ligase subunit beta [Sphingorhabdus sp. Alg239-R122]|uniref:glycine--tRNA ligase subunit beta n=1 Tax=Sphingorhabdus sp. Alg239-R122 TaxID=2305989 RepID=UPI0013DA3906|nr:glycine--tRNA ligase subunit beta [Sphingorhabdus sp. Alg239-R122]
MTDFLLEILSEEIPARMQAKARTDLEKLFAAQLGDAGLKSEDITVYSTPRRLALIAKGLPVETEAVSEEAKGPPEGAPDQAVDGFCRKNGVTRDQLEVRHVKGRPTYFAVVDTPGRATRDVLAEAIPAIIKAFPWPKSQRWGDASATTESLRWVRPLQGIVAIFGDDLVECEIGDVASCYDTVGHRFHHDGAITIGGVDDYVEKLRACHVIVDHAEREAIIREGAVKAAADAGLALIEDEGLVIENAGLTEWPVPLLGRFDEAFLDVPEEVIQLTTRINQKYFVVRDDAGKLTNAFVCTANIAAHDGGKAIVAGNEKVLAARLADAKFFWELDQKTMLEQHAEKLKDIVFHEKLGTVADKVERVAKLARWLCEEGIVKGDADMAEQAACLCKADLVTEMVGEFPELQGLMGGYYAEKEGLPTEVSDAIRDHYKPVGQGDNVPSAPVTVAVSLADKLDTLVGFFQIDEKPTGSKDPFALRRAAIGILSLILNNDIRVSIRDLITAAAHEGGLDAGRDIATFFIDRLKVQQKDAGIKHDMIDAVVVVETDGDNVRMVNRVKALQSFVETEDGTNLLAGYKRASNILKKEAPEDVVADADAQKALSYTPEKAEAGLIAALDSAEPKAAAAITAEDFEGAMAALASLRGPIDSFFEDVTVNDADPVKREARLGLLMRVRNAVHTVADFSKIEG